MALCRQRPLAWSPRNAVMPTNGVSSNPEEEHAPLLGADTHETQKSMQRYLALGDSRWLEELLAQVELQGGSGGHHYATGTVNSRMNLDYSDVSAYLLVLQQVGGVAAMATISVLAPVGLAQAAVSPLRTLLLTALVGAGLLTRPLLTRLSLPLLSLHRALRWAGVLWLLALTAEQLSYAACASQAHVLTASRIAALAVGTLILSLGAVARLVWPTSRSDAVVVAALGALLVMGMVPQTLLAGQGPFSHSLDTVSAATRCARGAAFALVYGTVVLSATPARPQSIQTMALVLRGMAASVWVLAVAPPLVLFAPVYVAILVSRRVSVHTDEGTDVRSAQSNNHNGPDRSKVPSAAHKALAEDDIESSSSSEETDALTARPRGGNGSHESRREKLLKMMGGGGGDNTTGTSWATHA